MPKPLLCLLLAGCAVSADTTIDTDAGTEDGCELVGTTALAVDEVSALGFSGDDLLLEAEGTFFTDLTWAVGGTTALTLSLVYDGQGAVLVDQERVASTEATTPDCVDRLEVGVTVGFVTDDGAFAESWEGVLYATASQVPAFAADTTVAALQGSYTVTTEADPTRFDEVEIEVAGSIEGGAPAGGVWGLGRGTLDEATLVEAFDIATFGAAAPTER